MEKKTTVKLDETKVAAKAVETKTAVKAEPAKAVEAAKNVEKKTEEKKAVAKAEPAKKEAAKKPAAKKAAPKKAAAKKEEMKPEIYVQFANQESVLADVVEKVKNQFVAEGNKASSIKTLQVYLKPEDYSAYYVINGKVDGRVDLF